MQHQRCHNITKVHLVKPKIVRGNLISKKKKLIKLCDNSNYLLATSQEFTWNDGLNTTIDADLPVSMINMQQLQVVGSLCSSFFG